MNGRSLAQPARFIILLPAILFAGCGPRTTAEHRARRHPVLHRLPPKSWRARQRLLALGKKTFEKECVACHGPAGNGEGDAAYLLYPRPRDFTSGPVPHHLDVGRRADRRGSVSHDLARHAGLGHAVVGAPAGGDALGARPLREVVLRSGRSHVNADREPDKFGSGGAGVVTVPPEPAVRRRRPGHGRASCSPKGCAPCHGATARGDGAQKQVDSKGYPDAAARSDARRLQGQPRARPASTAASSPGCRDRRCRRAATCRATTPGISSHFVRSLSSDAQRAKVGDEEVPDRRHARRRRCRRAPTPASGATRPP